VKGGKKGGACLPVAKERGGRKKDGALFSSHGLKEGRGISHQDCGGSLHFPWKKKVFNLG